jgi:hypothetical protein
MVALTDVFVKMRILISIKRLEKSDNAGAAKLLTLTLEDIKAYDIVDISCDRKNRIKTSLKNALVFAYKSFNDQAILELKNAGLELDMDKFIRRQMVLRDSDSHLNSLPYDIREHISRYI